MRKPCVRQGPHGWEIRDQRERLKTASYPTYLHPALRLGHSTFRDEKRFWERAAMTRNLDDPQGVGSGEGRRDGRRGMTNGEPQETKNESYDQEVNE